MVPNAGFEAGLGQKTKVQRLAWAWKGSKSNSKERRLNPLQAVTEGRELANTYAAKVAAAGGQRRDVVVHVVFATSDDLSKIAPNSPVPLLPEDPHADSNDLEVVRENMRNVCIGFVLHVLDRANGAFISSARPLVLEESALRLLESVVNSKPEIEK